ncbi:MAG: DNA-3-methyladenine glycosylase I [Candidatus Nanoarchaeia archaeon]
MSYCKTARELPKSNIHRDHHDSEHGRHPMDDDDLFRRLVLEINQAGLSFDIVLKKKETIYREFSSIDKVSKFKEKDIKRLLENSGVIRNRLKIESIIYNAKKIKQIQKEQKSFKAWLDAQENLKKDEWVKLFKKTFKFTGGEITNEFLMSTNYLPGAHDEDCKYYKKK